MPSAEEASADLRLKGIFMDVLGAAVPGWERKRGEASDGVKRKAVRRLQKFGVDVA